MQAIFEIGAWMLGRKIADFMDDSSQLKKEQLTHMQMQNEIMRLQMKVAEMETEKAIEYWPTAEEVEAELREIERRTGIANE